MSIPTNKPTNITPPITTVFRETTLNQVDSHRVGLFVGIIPNHATTDSHGHQEKFPTLRSRTLTSADSNANPITTALSHESVNIDAGNSTVVAESRSRNVARLVAVAPVVVAELVAATSSNVASVVAAVVAGPDLQQPLQRHTRTCNNRCNDTCNVRSDTRKQLETSTTHSLIDSHRTP